jgi:hypothetical protein
MILAIDPGNIETGFCLINDNYTIIEKGKWKNEDLLAYIYNDLPSLCDVVIEMVASYGMAVGQTVFDTCVWIGRFHEASLNSVRRASKIYRKDIKMNICGQTRAKDSNIRQALVDRFSYDRHKAKGGKGTKSDPGFFFGFKSDIWAAYALGVTYLDTRQA